MAQVDDRELDGALLSLLSRYPDGLELEALRKSLPKPFQVSVKRIRDRIEALAAAGRAHRWGAAVGPFPLAMRGRDRLLEVLGAGSAKSTAQIKRSLPKTMRSPPAIKRLIESALAERVIYEHPDPKAKSKSKRYARAPADPARYLAPIEKEIARTLRRLSAAGVDRALLIATLSGGTVVATKERDPRVLLDAVLEVRPDARTHVLVSVRDLRRHLSWPKSEFDRTVLALAREGRITLHHHDHPTGLSPSDREDLVRDDHGNFFVGLVLEEAA